MTRSEEFEVAQEMEALRKENRKLKSWIRYMIENYDVSGWELREGLKLIGDGK